MYGQDLAKNLAGDLHTLRDALFVHLGVSTDQAPDDRSTDDALTATFRLHEAMLKLWRYSQVVADDSSDDIKPANPEESTGQYNPPGSDPDPRDQDLAMQVVMWLGILEERLLAALHEASTGGHQAFIDAAVPALHRMAQARRRLAN
ncbi:MAG: hypothetical protein SX243_00950 [Acidobacteriota bacterium]|nr:hypothetical protein [Acidobacteriota bacterium]